MAATGSATVEAQPSAAQVEELLRVCEGLQRALARAKLVRQFLMIATLAFIVIVCYMFYTIFKRFAPENMGELQSVAQKKLTENSDEYMRELQTLADNSRPVVVDAFLKQAKKDMPAYMHAAGQERERFVEEMQDRVSKSLLEHYGKVLDRHQKLLEEEFPLIKDQETHRRMMGNLHLAVEKLVKKYYVEEMRGQILALYDGWDQFPRADVPAKGDPSLEDQFIGGLVEVLRKALAENEGAPKS
jgi:hypothetical protein